MADYTVPEGLASSILITITKTISVVSSKYTTMYGVQVENSSKGLAPNNVLCTAATDT